MMRLKFAQKFFEVGSIMMSNPQSPTLNNIKYVLSIYDEALSPQLAQCQDIRGILQLVSRNCSLDDITMLEFFINTFNIDEAKPVIEEYKEAVEEFKKTKLSKCLKEKFSYASLLQCERITIVVDDIHATEFTLNDVKSLSSAIFEKSSRHIRLNVIKEGSVFITCSFSLILSEQLITVAQGNIDVLRANKVKRLTIGYCTVYEVQKIDDTSAPATIESDESPGLLKQLMISLAIQIISSKEEVTYEESMTLKKEAESLIQRLDKTLNASVAKSDKFKAEYDELKEMKEILKEQLASFHKKYEKLKEMKETFEEQLVLSLTQESIEATEYEVQDYFEGIAEKLPEIADAFNKSVSDIKGLVDEATRGLEEIRKHSEVRQVSQVKESYQSLSKTTKTVHSYLDKVNDLYRLLTEQTPDVIEDVESGRLKSSDQLAVQIDKILQDSTDFYIEVLDACFEEFATNCDEAQGELRRLQEKEEFKEAAAKVAAGGAVVGGIATSVLVGIFTAGIGLAVGLGMTAGATALTTGVAIVLAGVFGDTAKSFAEMNNRLKRLEQIRQIRDIINEIHLTNTKIKRMTPDERTNLAMKMRSTYKESEKHYSKTSSRLKVAAEIKVAFANKVDDVFPN
uniref:Uncharacterized protein n=1 Tax=Amphimedon queenslandica TaxID=400682 RepID=A0A1X7TUY9_AMPQE